MSSLNLPIEQKRILNVFFAANAIEHQQGFDWYYHARAVALNFAKVYDCPLEKVVGIIAALSPGASWEKNLTDTELVLKAFRNRIWVASRWFPKVGTYGKPNRDKCERIWRAPAGADIAAMVGGKKGPKIAAFYRCILDPYHDSEVVIDRHALSLMMGVKQETALTPAQYKRAADHYRAAAKIAGVRPLELQAITWVVWRNRSEDFTKGEQS